MHDPDTPARGGSLLGHAVKRREDPALLRGERHYLDDLRQPNMLHAVFIQSPIAHGRIESIDADDLPDGAHIYTGEDLQLTMAPPPVVDQAYVRTVPARDTVRFVGDVVAVVLADSHQSAVDAAEQVWIDYDPLPAIVDVERSLDPDAPILTPGTDTNRVWFQDLNPDLDPLAGAEVIIEQRFVQQRLAAVTMEPGGILAMPDGEGGLLIQLGTQDPVGARRNIAKALGLDAALVRVQVPAVGGGFGAKGPVYPQHVLVAELARRLDRPVHWMETRTENLVNMVHGRAQTQYAKLGATREGRVTGLDLVYLQDLGAYPTIAGVLAKYTLQMSSGVYDIPAIRVHAESRLTNLTPVGPYRGAGRPEAIQMLERMMDLLALELGIDKAEIRRRNLMAPFASPKEVVTGVTYDSGDYEASLDLALELSDYPSLIAERDRRRTAGDRLQLGVGVSTYLETTVGITPPRELGGVRLESDGTVTVFAGGSSHGQAHQTAFSQLVAGIMGIDMDLVTVVQSDTALVPDGVAGTYASRTLQLAGSSVLLAAEKVVSDAKDVAESIMEVSAGDLEVRPGGLGVIGVPGAMVTWQEIAGAAAEQGVELADQQLFESGGSTFPFGTHIAVIEIDMDTGWARLVRHVGVDDCGTILNPMLALGQQHGGVSQGVGQALLEGFLYDGEGNPLTGNLTSYLIPTAVDLPPLEETRMITPSPNNPLGAKGIGEAGTLGATPAVHSAVMDALAPLGIRHIDMPLTPSRVWSAINQVS
jgi:carbon-monoxide dehydrogenase large subunit